MNLNILNKQMISREIENEFSLYEDGLSIRSMLNLINFDISDYSMNVGMSLYGSFEKIDNEIKQNDNINYYKISKYLTYIEWNIKHLDITKIDDDLSFKKFDKRLKLFLCKEKNKFVKNIFILYFYSISKNNIDLEKTSLNILSNIVNKLIETKSLIKCKELINIYDETKINTLKDVKFLIDKCKI